jgi:hypothetical protein
VLTSMVIQTHRLDCAKPRTMENDFASVESTEDGLVIHNSRYKTRTRPGEEVSAPTPNISVEAAYSRVF